MGTDFHGTRGLRARALDSGPEVNANGPSSGHVAKGGPGLGGPEYYGTPVRRGTFIRICFSANDGS